MDRLIELIDRCVVPVRGLKLGTGWFVGPDLVATSRHIVDGRPIVTIDGARIPADSVIQVDDTDVVLLRMPVRRSNWMLLAEEWAFDERCLVRAATADSFDSAMVTIEGTRGTSFDYQLKVGSGQIIPGFSGAPVVSLASGRVIGQVHKTRDKDNALGGYLVPSATIAAFLNGLQSNEETATVAGQWRAAVGGNPIEHITPPPPPPFGTLHGRVTEVADLQSRTSLGSVRVLAGPPSSGKTALIAAWMSSESVDLKGNIYSRYAYVNLTGFILGRSPVLRALAEHLEVLTDTDDRRALEIDDQAAAYVQLGIRRKLGAAPVGLALDAGEGLFQTASGQKSLLEVLQAGVLGWAAVVVVAWAPAPELPLGLRTRPPISIGSLGKSDAANLLAAETGLGVAVAQDAIELIDEPHRLPGVIVSAGGRIDLDGDAFKIAEELTNIAVRQFLTGIDRITAHVPDGERLWPRWLVQSISQGTNADPHDQAPLAHALGWNDASGEIRPEVRLAGFRLLADAAILGHIDHELIEEVLDLLLDAAPRQILELLLCSNLAGLDTESVRKVHRRIRDRIARMTVGDPMGPVLTDQTNTTALRMAAEPLTTADLLLLARTSPDADSFLSEVRAAFLDGGADYRIDDQIGAALVKQAFAEVENRVNFQIEAVLARELFLDNIESDAHSIAAASHLELLHDSARGLLFVSRHDDAMARMTELHSALERSKPAESNMSVQAWTRTRMSLDVLRARAGVVAIDEVISRLDRDLDDQTITARDALTARATLLDFGAARGMPAIRITEQLQRLLEDASRVSTVETRAAIVARVLAVVRSASVELPLSERAELLEKALTIAADIHDDARALSRFGDARPLSAVIRGLLALSDCLRMSTEQSERQRAHTLRLNAIAMLREATLDAPNATLWGLYMRAVDRIAPSAYDAALDPTWMSREQLTSADGTIREYRKWSRARRMSSAREFENEVWILRRSWAREGSLINAVIREDPNWQRLPVDAKLDAFKAQYLKRRARLHDLAKRWNGQTEVHLERFRIERQYQRALAQFRNGVTNEEPVFAVLDEAIRERGPLAELQLVRASYMRYIGRTDDAIIELRALLGSSIANRATARRTRQTLAQALIDKVARQENQDVEGLCGEAIQLLGGLEEANAESALIGLRARVELHRGVLPPSAEALWPLFTTSGPLNEVWTKREIFERCENLLRDQGAPFGLQLIAQEFTNPKILLKFSSILLRWHVLLGDKKIQRVVAALTAMEGARIFAATSSRTEQLAYLQGRALLIACEETMSICPLHWSTKTSDLDIDDLELSFRRLQSALDRSVGGFREVIKDMIARGKYLRTEIENS